MKRERCAQDFLNNRGDLQNCVVFHVLLNYYPHIFQNLLGRFKARRESKFAFE